MCEFCDRDVKGYKSKKMPFNVEGDGIGTMDQMVQILHTELRSHYAEYMDPNEKIEPKDYIYLKGPGNTLWCQTSSREYRDLGIEIKYCPFCGRKL